MTNQLISSSHSSEPIVSRSQLSLTDLPRSNNLESRTHGHSVRDDGVPDFLVIFITNNKQKIGAVG
jgi:hypothetical protein